MKRASITCLTIALAGCVPTQFQDLRNEASTVAIAPPSDYGPRGFGRVVTGYATTLHGEYGSRVAASAGASSPFEVRPLLIGETLRLETTVLKGCDEDAPCMRGAGVSLAGLVRWGAREMCVAAAAPDSGEIMIRCEDDVSHFEVLHGPSGERFGESAAGLPDHPLGRAIFGAPGASGGGGAVYLLPDRMAPIELDLSEGAGAGGELGTSVAAAVIDADRVMIAASAPVGPVRRVIVATSDIAGGAVTTHVHGCLDSSTDAWGGALAIGDLNGDGALDVAIGSGAGPTRLDVVRIYDGAAMPGACDGSWAPAVELACPTIAGIDCAESGFGAALASGDVDADGVDDLIVGAPFATVEREGGAGAAFVFRGSASLAELATTVVPLTSSSPSPGAELGSAVAVSPGALVNDTSGARRAEPIVGAPGIDRVYVFLCSGLSGDSPDTTGVRCQP